MHHVLRWPLFLVNSSHPLKSLSTYHGRAHIRKLDFNVVCRGLKSFFPGQDDISIVSICTARARDVAHGSIHALHVWMRLWIPSLVAPHREKTVIWIQSIWVLFIWILKIWTECSGRELRVSQTAPGATRDSIALGVTQNQTNEKSQWRWARGGRDVQQVRRLLSGGQPEFSFWHHIWSPKPPKSDPSTESNVSPQSCLQVWHPSSQKNPTVGPEIDQWAEHMSYVQEAQIGSSVLLGMTHFLKNFILGLALSQSGRTHALCVHKSSALPCCDTTTARYGHHNI